MRVDFAGNERIFFTLALLPLSSTIWLEGGEWISYGKKDMQKMESASMTVSRVTTTRRSTASSVAGTGSVGEAGLVELQGGARGGASREEATDVVPSNSSGPVSFSSNSSRPAVCVSDISHECGRIHANHPRPHNYRPVTGSNVSKYRRDHLPTVPRH